MFIRDGLAQGYTCVVVMPTTEQVVDKRDYLLMHLWHPLKYEVFGGEVKFSNGAKLLFAVADSPVKIPNALYWTFCKRSQDQHWGVEWMNRIDEKEIV